MSQRSSTAALNKLLREIRGCTECAESLDHAPRPVLVAHPEARILIIGQAPGRRVHESGVAWADASGKRLREWLGVDDESFYNPAKFALMPMGFCFPGSGASGDLPPRPECAPLWHDALLKKLPQVRLTLLLSRYALQRYANAEPRATLTEIVRDWRSHAPSRVPLPHPSPRNNRWLTRNPWFADELLPELRKLVRKALTARARGRNTKR